MFDHPYQEFNSLRALLHHLRVDHNWSDADLPSHYYDRVKNSLLYGAVCGDHEDLHVKLAKQRKTGSYFKPV